MCEDSLVPRPFPAPVLIACSIKTEGNGLGTRLSSHIYYASTASDQNWSRERPGNEASVRMCISNFIRGYVLSVWEWYMEG